MNHEEINDLLLLLGFRCHQPISLLYDMEIYLAKKLFQKYNTYMEEFVNELSKGIGQISKGGGGSIPSMPKI